MGFQEDHFWTNIRIMLCVACCAFGCYAQFVLKFPKDRLMIGVCIAGYFFFTGLVTLIDMLVIKTSVICIKVSGQTVFVDVTMQPFSHEMTIGLRNHIGLKKDTPISHKTSVGEYFDSDGYLGQEEILAAFMKLVKRFEKEHDGKEATCAECFQCQPLATLWAGGFEVVFTAPVPDPHRILGVPRGASHGDIRQAYLQKAKQLHPDTSQVPDSHLAFQQLQAAYKELSDGRSEPFRVPSEASRPTEGSSHGFNARHGFPGSGPYYSQYTRASPSPPKSTWELLREGRAWRRGGLVHRSVARFTVNLLGCWPLWLLCSAAFLASRGRSSFGGLQYDAEGQAYVRSGGSFRRVPQYDDIPD
ncbi:unnamed protein product [Symbiodinium sp. KB8]|nr:unnamed protein product [Symbiodinium sp. KB8]